MFAGTQMTPCGVPLLLLTFVTLTTPLAAQTRDTVILRSGHPVIGEIKSLRRGNLEFDTDEMDLVNIDWDDVALLISHSFFEVDRSSL